MVEGKGIEPLTHACKAHVFPLAPTPPKYMAPVERIELPLTVLETAALPLYYTGINFDTLRPMCVSKHSSWMNPLALGPENALILRNFTTSVFTTSFPSSGPPTFVV